MREAVLALVLTLFVPLAAGAQDDQVRVIPEQREQAALTLRQYRSLVEAYRAGDPTAPQRVLEWTPKRLAIVLGLIRVGKGSGPLGEEEEPHWDAGLLRAATLLHTEASLLRIRGLDAQETDTQLALAGRLLALGAPETNRFASAWYVVVARVLRDRMSTGSAEVLLDAGRRRLPGDAAVLCESGALLEAKAANRLLSWPVRTLRGTELVEPGEMPSGSRIDGFKEARSVLLTRSAQFLRDGVRAGASDPLCRLRLGRVNGLRGRYGEAEPILEDLERHEYDAVSYMASMFRGGDAERQGRQSEAEAHYRAAIARFPRGQAAYVALSQILLSTRRVHEAREALASAVNAEPNDRRDPWWFYHFEPSHVVDARYEALKREALQ